MTKAFQIILVALAALSAAPLRAQEGDFSPVPASEVVLADLLYQARIVAVFADDPQDPNFIRQMALLAINAKDLADRDVVVIFDTAPFPPSELRKSLRPRGFSLVIMDKDGKIALRKPLPWDTREISRAIDKFPSRRDEVLLENSGSGVIQTP